MLRPEYAHAFTGCWYSTSSTGGSTAFAELLLTAFGTIRLQEKAEEQWLLPALCADKVRWDPELAFDPAEFETCGHEPPGNSADWLAFEAMKRS